MVRESRPPRLYCQRAGTLHGVEVAWYPNGKLKLFWTWVDGKKEGAVMTWHRGGGKHLVGYKRHGLADGRWQSWHDNGQKASESVWEANKRVSGECWDRGGARCEPSRCLTEADCR